MKFSTCVAPAAVTHSLKCNLTGESGSEYLVISKVNRLDVYELSVNGPLLRCIQELYGTIASLAIVPYKVRQKTV